MTTDRTWVTPGGAVIELAHKADPSRWRDAAGMTVEVIDMTMTSDPRDEGQWLLPRLANGRTASTLWNLRGWVRTVGELAEAGVDVGSLEPGWELTVTAPSGAVTVTDLGWEVDEAELGEALEAVRAVRQLPAAS
jgi:hypothetical protein